MKKHLAILHKGVIDAILSGQKTVESRFSEKKVVPFGAISVGDLVFMKEPGGDIIGQFRVRKVFSYEGLTEKDVTKIFADLGKEISWGNPEEEAAFLTQKKTARFGTLIFIGESERLITSPVIFKKTDRRPWVVLEINY